MCIRDSAYLLIPAPPYPSLPALFRQDTTYAWRPHLRRIHTPATCLLLHQPHPRYEKTLICLPSGAIWVPSACHLAPSACHLVPSGVIWCHLAGCHLATSGCHQVPSGCHLGVVWMQSGCPSGTIWVPSGASGCLLAPSACHLVPSGCHLSAIWHHLDAI